MNALQAVETQTLFIDVPNGHSVFQTIADEISPATREAYAVALRRVDTFYTWQGWAFIPTDEDGNFTAEVFVIQILSYLQHLADQGRSVSTISKTLAAMKHRTSFTSPHAHAALSTRPVKALITGLTRQRKTDVKRKAAAFTTANLAALYKHLAATPTVRSVRDRAMLSLGIATALRASSLTELRLSDLTQAVTMNGYNVRVRFSKTDQMGEGTYIPVARSNRRTLDPVSAVGAWVALLEAFGYTARTHSEFPLFPAVRGNKGIQETAIRNPAITITETVRRLVEDSGVDTVNPTRFSSHSLRATFITLSNQAGVTEKDIALISGHKDMSVLRGYDRTTAERSAQTDYLAV